MLVVLFSLMTIGCADRRRLPPIGYLGIPERESYTHTQQGSKFLPIKEVRRHGYWRISEVKEVPYSDYLRAGDNAKYVANQKDYIFFSTEMMGDFVNEHTWPGMVGPGEREWVTVLDRWKAKKN